MNRRYNSNLIRLAVNADDFGYTTDVNDGIVEAHRHGILTSTTLMANGDAFDHAVRLAGETPTLDIGCHLTLIGGEALTGGRLPGGFVPLFQALASKKLSPYEEFAAQVRKIRAAGIQPTHLDTHKHTHLLPPVLKAVAQVAREFGIKWVRRPFDFEPSGRPGATRFVAALLMRTQWGRFERTLAGCRITDRFMGFALTGQIGPADLEQALRRVPEGFTEFMCHPGFCRDELKAANTRLKESRQRELDALLSPGVRRVVEERGIVLTGFS
jgi:predicted glycoside hydrolase/deacetylase ChbG (UPF0249 family)